MCCLIMHCSALFCQSDPSRGIFMTGFNRMQWSWCFKYLWFVYSDLHSSFHLALCPERLSSSVSFFISAGGSPDMWSEGERRVDPGCYSCSFFLVGWPQILVIVAYFSPFDGCMKFRWTWLLTYTKIEDNSRWTVKPKWKTKRLCKIK